MTTTQIVLLCINFGTLLVSVVALVMARRSFRQAKALEKQLDDRDEEV